MEEVVQIRKSDLIKLKYEIDSTLSGIYSMNTSQTPTHVFHQTKTCLERICYALQSFVYAVENSNSEAAKSNKIDKTIDKIL